MSSFIALNDQTHRSLKVDIKHPHSLAEGRNLLPIYMAEFGACSAEYPVVFAKNNETGQISPVVMLGFKPSENFFYAADGWHGRYAPVSAQPSPLVVLPDQDNSENLIVCVDETSVHLSDERGEPLFEEDGRQSAYLQQQSQFAAELRAHAEQTASFVDKLIELSLVKSNPLSVSPANEKAFNLTGLYVVDETALNELEAEKFLELRSLGYLKPLFAAVSSMGRLDDLLTLRANQKTL